MFDHVTPILTPTFVREGVKAQRVHIDYCAINYELVGFLFGVPIRVLLRSS